MSSLTDVKTKPIRKILMASTLLSAVLFLTPVSAANKTIPIMVQLNNYQGENAYFVAYLVDAKGLYQKTLWLSGNEEKYFHDLPRWWKYLSRKPQDLDGITGASTASGDRNIIKVEIEEEFIDAGYQIRVETAVEEKNHYPIDIEFNLSAENAKKKMPGTGYVRTVIMKL